MSGFNRITKERYIEIKEEAKEVAAENIEKEEKNALVEERRKNFSSEDERIVFIGNLYFPDDDEFLKDYNMYNRNIKLMADNYDIDTYIVRCKVLEMAMFKEVKNISNEIMETSIMQEEATVEETQESETEDNGVPSDFDDMTDSFLEESSTKVSEIGERNVEIETLQKSLIESIRVAKVSVSRRNQEIDKERKELEKEREEFEIYRREEMENLSNERIHLDEEEERLLALKDKIMDTIRTFEQAKANLANLFKNDNE